VDEGGDVTAVVFPSEQPGAISLVLPHAQRYLRLAAGDLEDQLAMFDDADAGDLVDLGAETGAGTGPLSAGRPRVGPW
jgi:hypothetical protein